VVWLHRQPHPPSDDVVEHLEPTTPRHCRAIAWQRRHHDVFVGFGQQPTTLHVHDLPVVDRPEQKWRRLEPGQRTTRTTRS
jgi:hypothetical protein